MDKNSDIGTMKLKMQTLSMAGLDPKEMKSVSALKENIMKEKSV